MAITVANLIAQIGADTTQFRLGMNEVEARLHQIKVRGENANATVNRMRASAEAYKRSAENMLIKASKINLDEFQAKINMSVDKLEDAQKRLENASSRYKQALTSGTEKNIIATQKELDKATRIADRLAEKVERAGSALSKASERKQGLIAGADYRLRMSDTMLTKSGEYERQNAANLDVQRAIADRIAQDAFEHRVRALNAVGMGAIRAGVAGGTALTAASTIGSNLEETMMRAFHNSSLTTKGLEVMRQTVSKLGRESGADLNQLIEGFRKIENYGNNAAQSSKILEVAMKSAVATGSDLGQTAELLASTMKTFKIPVEQAASTMDQLHTAANLSSLELSQLVNNAAPAYAAASRMGVSFTETNAAMVLFTRYLQGDAPRAVTQWVNVLNKIGNPTKQVRIALANLREDSKKAGVDLENSFTQAGLRARGFANIIEDISKVARVKGVVPEDLISKLIPNLRGTAGAGIAIQHIDEYRRITEQLNDSVNKQSITQKQYNESLSLVGVQVRKVKNDLLLLSNDIARILSPQISKLAESARNLINNYTSLDDATRKNIVNTALLSSGFLIVFGITSKLIVGIASLRTALVTLGFVAEGATFKTFLFSPFSKTLGVVSLLALALGGLYYGLSKLSEQYENLDKQVADQLKSNDKNAKLSLELSEKVNGLVQQYYELAASGQSTQEVLDQIAKLNPDLVTGFDKQGQALGLVEDAVNKVTEAYKNMSREAQLASVAITANKRTELITKKYQLLEQIEADNAILRSGRTPSIQTPYDGFRSGLYSGRIPGDELNNQQRLEIFKRIQARQAEILGIDKQTEQLSEQMRKALHPEKYKQSGKSGVTNPFSKNYNLRAPQDLLADLYDKPGKDKKPKKSKEQLDAERLSERFTDAINDLVKQRMFVNNNGPLAEANWNLTHDFAKFRNTDLGRVYIDAAKSLERTQNEARAKDLLTAATKELSEAKLSLGDISERERLELELSSKTYEKISKSDLDAIRLVKLKTIQLKEELELKKKIAEINEFIRKPLEKEKSAFEIGFEYSSERLGKSGIGFMMSLQNAGAYAYNSLMAQRRKEEKETEERLAKQNADAIDRASKSLQDFENAIYSAKREAYIGLVSAKDEEEAKRLEFFDKMEEKLKDHITLNKENENYYQRVIADAWSYISARAKEAELTAKITGINKQVATGLKDLSDKLIINSQGIRITEEEWKKMTRAQKEAAKQFVFLKNMKDLLDETMSGIEEIFFRTLNNIRENGFRSFFRDIITMFDDLLFQLAAKWLASYFVNQIIGALGNIFGSKKSASKGVQGGWEGLTDPSSIISGGMVKAAYGAPAIVGNMMWVGENGPEPFIPKRGGRVISNDKIMTGSRNYNIQIVTNDSESFRRSEHQTLSKIVHAIKRTERRM